MDGKTKSVLVCLLASILAGLCCSCSGGSDDDSSGGSGGSATDSGITYFLCPPSSSDDYDMGMIDGFNAATGKYSFCMYTQGKGSVQEQYKAATTGSARVEALPYVFEAVSGEEGVYYVAKESDLDPVADRGTPAEYDHYNYTKAYCMIAFKVDGELWLLDQRNRGTVAGVPVAGKTNAELVEAAKAGSAPSLRSKYFIKQ